MLNNLTSEQLATLQEISTNVITDKTIMFIKNNCECKVYIYNKDETKPECSTDWYFFIYQILIPKMFGDIYIQHLRNMLVIQSTDNDFHPIEYLWIEYLRLYRIGKNKKNKIL